MSKASRKGRGVRGRKLPAIAPSPKSSAQLDAEIAEALTATAPSSEAWGYRPPKRTIAEVIETLNAALKRFPSLVKVSGWDFGGELVAASGIHGAVFDEDVLELRDYPGVVIDLYETRRARRVVTR